MALSSLAPVAVIQITSPMGSEVDIAIGFQSDHTAIDLIAKPPTISLPTLRGPQDYKLVPAAAFAKYPRFETGSVGLKNRKPRQSKKRQRASHLRIRKVGSQ